MMVYEIDGKSILQANLSEAGKFEMSWELSIQAPELDDGPGRAPKLPSNCSSLQACVSSFFPETKWETGGQGTCDFGNGVIEFDVHEEPDGSIWLRVHDADPSLELIALARTVEWDLINHSTGELLDDEEDFTASQIAQIQQRALSQVTSTGSRGRPKGHKMPKVKAQIPLSDLKPDWMFDELSLVSLGAEEVALDLFEEYRSALSSNQRISGLKGHPCFAPAEVVLPNGQRFAAILMPRTNAEVSAYYDQYWKTTSRQVAKLQGKTVVLEDGSTFATKDCLHVMRADGRARRSES